MNDERIVEVIGQWLWDKGRTRTTEVQPHASEILAALRDAGFDVYRPDECEGVTVEVMNVARGTGPIDGFFDAGSYRLVPIVDGERAWS